MRDVWVYAGSRERAAHGPRRPRRSSATARATSGRATRSSRRRPTAPRSAGRCSPSSCSARTSAPGARPRRPAAARARSCRTSACCSSSPPEQLARLRRARGRRRADRRAVLDRRARGARRARDAASRSSTESSTTIRAGSLELNPATYQVAVDGDPVGFTYMEYELLRFLMSHPNRVFSREALLQPRLGLRLLRRRANGRRPHPPRAREARRGARRAHQDGAERRLPVRARPRRAGRPARLRSVALSPVVATTRGDAFMLLPAMVVLNPRRLTLSVWLTGAMLAAALVALGVRRIRAGTDGVQGFAVLFGAMCGWFCWDAGMRLRRLAQYRRALRSAARREGRVGRLRRRLPLGRGDEGRGVEAAACGPQGRRRRVALPRPRHRARPAARRRRRTRLSGRA